MIQNLAQVFYEDLHIEVLLHANKAVTIIAPIDLAPEQIIKILEQAVTNFKDFKDQEF